MENGNVERRRVMKVFSSSSPAHVELYRKMDRWLDEE
jgi:hypothetical protein